ncbi:type I restriction endonuclease subunit M [Bremerella cremea]|uniref:type I restriction endonuclease subunit M n=1 Tax=Bremerella cremea TaxID=1031537 RepID=UPI0031F0DE06
MLIIPMNALFPLGQILATSNALDHLTPEEIAEGLQRDASGDWGNVDLHDAQVNQDALDVGNRLLSAYGEGDRRFWIITEADRSVTTILLPSDY